ncbi:carcinoembryonic antigen-related cell adhesion molecule 1-like isoform X2 [Scyliorhinus canicula]|uniref:carcinoembryonic antigen-related cell adhesion molecule 1-like isoform X2 n=1 Tax=Scyliorhinus canicula TaxID=7830 RepID=UPI0018F697E5|nr:carcinoembryonic antigen-related cell adhesion molecule 1-like isoform X2 [Scyliorhinus canicula]
MERVRLTALAIWLFLPAVECQDLTISVNESLVNAAVEDLVLLSVRPSIQVKRGNWKHNGMDVVRWIGTTVDINYQYTDRVELVHNVSLRLKSVTVSDSGEYIVTMNPYSGAEGKARIHLVVFEPISTVYITSNDSNTVRENASVCLTCHVVGNWTKIIWSFNGNVVNSNERKILASGNSTLTIISVNAINVGEYQCVARSPVSEKASELYSLHIGKADAESCNIDKWIVAVAVLGVISVAALVAVGVLVFKMQSMALKETPGHFTLPTVSGSLSAMPAYENCMLSVNKEQKCGNEDQNDSSYMALLFSNESVYDQLGS